VSGRDEYLELADWRRRVSELWADWRRAATDDPRAATEAFREARQRLFTTHPQSPVPAHERGRRRLAWWPYDPSFRIVGRVESGDTPNPNEAADDSSPAGAGGLTLVPSSDGSPFGVRRVGRVTLTGPLEGLVLPLLWIEGYGNGLFLPFRDATNGHATYGAGRYLLDTAKSADHGPGPADGTLLLDLNMAYHPSCAYDPRWACPLAPPDSRLSVPVPVGERLG
jgi:uncharacterized protein (DUF1684 family)